MFVQVKYQLRSRGRSVLVLCIAALLAACMAFYVGNIGVNKAALQSLSDSVPVTVRITSRNGAKTAGLNIEAKPFDHLTEAGVHDVRCTAVAAGAFSRRCARRRCSSAATRSCARGIRLRRWSFRQTICILRTAKARRF